MLQIVALIILLQFFEYHTLLNYILIGCSGWIIINIYVVYYLYQKINNHYNLYHIFTSLLKIIINRNMSKIYKILNVIMEDNTETDESNET